MYNATIHMKIHMGIFMPQAIDCAALQPIAPIH